MVKVGLGAVKLPGWIGVCSGARSVPVMLLQPARPVPFTDPHNRRAGWRGHLDAWKESAWTI